uniref:Uncharacterized protein n=1 Tax=Cajanus cajan TaxID=3821 RepID=A0A151RPU6_CAJCA|nr:hypothetical protein KK1_033924 [Cajanus cajan]
MARTSSPHRRTPKCHHKYLKPGALAKLRDSKIAINRTTNYLFLSQLSSPPAQHHHTLHHQNDAVPSFHPPIYLRRPRCLLRKKLFAVAPSFTHADHTYRF